MISMATMLMGLDNNCGDSSINASKMADAFVESTNSDTYQHNVFDKTPKNTSQTKGNSRVTTTATNISGLENEDYTKQEQTFEESKETKNDAYPTKTSYLQNILKADDERFHMKNFIWEH